ncbi:hypothetical protein E4U44_007125 [Claviceps purpurea]|nr:hypothetical protein E4U44_007125 [Claviceps purpurea]
MGKQSKNSKNAEDPKKSKRSKSEDFEIHHIFQAKRGQNTQTTKNGRSPDRPTTRGFPSPGQDIFDQRGNQGMTSIPGLQLSQCPLRRKLEPQSAASSLAMLESREDQEGRDFISKRPNTTWCSLTYTRSSLNRTRGHKNPVHKTTFGKDGEEVRTAVSLKITAQNKKMTFTHHVYIDGTGTMRPGDVPM